MAKKSKKSTAPKLASLYINPTSHCNLMCKHCWLSPSLMGSQEICKEADSSIIKNAIDQAIPLGLRSVKFTGGEPFLAKDFFDLVEYARSKDLRVDVETNGTLLDKKAALILKELKVEFVSISLDSTTPLIHDEFRQLKGSFKKSVQAVKLLVKMGINNQVIFSLVRKNSKELFKMPGFCQNLKCKSLKINTISPISRAKALDKKGELLSIAENIDHYNKFEKRFLLKPRPDFFIFYDIPIVFKNARLLTFGNDSYRCTIHNILGVLPDGRVSICGIGFLKEKTILGDLRITPLKKIWESSTLLKKIRRDIPANLKGICSNCLFKDQCLGKCLAQSLYENKEHNDSFDFCSHASDLNLFPNNRKKIPS